MSVISISCVVYHTESEVLHKTCTSLSEALRRLTLLADFYLIDNFSANNQLVLNQLVSFFEDDPYLRLHIVSGQGNVGYGAGNNLVIQQARSDYHLILNPDVILHSDTLGIGLQYLKEHPEVVMLAPDVWEPDSSARQYLCKRYPSIIVLLVRLLRFPLLTKLFSAHLSRYEYRSFIDKGEVFQPTIISGCFMLCRTKALKVTAGFDKRFFLYFEDFDLSLQMAKQGKVIYLPQMKIQHYGGGAGRKGWRHVWMFCCSAWKFFNKHGWRFI